MSVIKLRDIINKEINSILNEGNYSNYDSIVSSAKKTLSDYKGAYKEENYKILDAALTVYFSIKYNNGADIVNSNNADSRAYKYLSDANIINGVYSFISKQERADRAFQKDYESDDVNRSDYGWIDLDDYGPGDRQWDSVLGELLDVIREYESALKATKLSGALKSNASKISEWSAFIDYLRGYRTSTITSKVKSNNIKTIVKATNDKMDANKMGSKQYDALFNTYSEFAWYNAGGSVKPGPLMKQLGWSMSLFSTEHKSGGEYIMPDIYYHISLKLANGKYAILTDSSGTSNSDPSLIDIMKIEIPNKDGISSGFKTGGYTGRLPFRVVTRDSINPDMLLKYFIMNDDLIKDKFLNNELKGIKTKDNLIEFFLKLSNEIGNYAADRIGIFNSRFEKSLNTFDFGPSPLKSNPRQDEAARKIFDKNFKNYVNTVRSQLGPLYKQFITAVARRGFTNDDFTNKNQSLYSVIESVIDRSITLNNIKKFSSEYGVNEPKISYIYGGSGIYTNSAEFYITSSEFYTLFPSWNTRPIVPCRPISILTYDWLANKVIPIDPKTTIGYPTWRNAVVWYDGVEKDLNDFFINITSETVKLGTKNLIGITSEFKKMK